MTMTALPFEVLIIIFEDLKPGDLKQCQLVSKLWNQASLKRLYSVAFIDTVEESRLYVRTIKSSPHLGKYLETIDTGNIFEKEKNVPIWDEHGLLDIIIKSCPNLLNLRHDTSSSPFWTKLMYAASQGQLSRLQYISCPFEDDYDYYVYTVLSFKNSLTTLDLPDLGNNILNLLDSEAYSTLHNKLGEFPCLKYLNISYISDQPISHYDALIDSCKHLKELTIYASMHGGGEDITRPGSPIYPRQNIDALYCRWQLINDDMQLNYTMQKFPNLKSLEVKCEGYDYEYLERDSSEVLMEFLRFATNIPKLNLMMLVEEQECINLWTNIINEKYKNIDLKISFSLPNEYDDPVVLINFEEHCELSLEFAPLEASEVLYLKFLSKSGENIRRLTLKDQFIKEEPGQNLIINSIHNIVQVIRLCPSLEHLDLLYHDDIPFSNSIAYRHFNLKSLTLNQLKDGIPTGILRNMSLILPNLKRIYYGNSFIQYGKSENITITMPDTSLDVLHWSFSKANFKKDDDLEIYIRYNVNSVERFYVAFEDELSPIGPKNYNRTRSSNAVYLDFTFQSLIKLQINEFTFTF